ncbi:type II CAAX prenyl endopeptidase Rce1 family protein [Mariniflexile sp. HMF6888]|uniref:CPBP family glutamic-type intramembrane protease n=1 Tax=Mariniflexile sp. HMF6888 TaxID=3373086 RepID=UPI0037952F96
MKTFLLDFKNILVNPTLFINFFFSWKQIASIFSYIFLGLIFFLLLGFFSVFIHRIWNVPLPYKNINISFFNAVLLAPIIEELSFRAILKKSKINFLFFISSFSYLIFGYLLKYDLFVYYIVLLIITLFYVFVKKKVDFLEPYSKKQVLYLVYISCFFFGFAHIINYDISLNILIPLLAILLFKVLGAFFLSLLRLKFGLMVSILFHFIINLSAFIIYNK